VRNKKIMSHTFHIPVLGLAYSIDTPLKVARYGISSVASIVDDIAIERIRKYHLEKNNEAFVPISEQEEDSRAKRITAYLNMMDTMVNHQFEQLKQQAFEPNTDITRYFEMLPPNAPLRLLYEMMLAEENSSLKTTFQNALRHQMQKGDIDVNIMSKVDKMNLNIAGEALEEIYTDALAALRGFAMSNLHTSVILSAGMNPRLYSYLESFKDFSPDENQELKKKVILKVSDFRSALIQAKFLAKKGIWVSEFRIESGLNCGGHAFATEGFLLGPILEEFKNKRTEMIAELFGMYQNAIQNKGLVIDHPPLTKISVQGGIGTAEENNFLIQYYQLDATGWGSPFLLVPEASNVDQDTLHDLAISTEEDFYISASSPLGIPFNNFRKSSGEKQRLDRIAKNRPGSPCTKKFLVSNTEFTEKPICLASREYQNLKIKELNKASLSAEDYQNQFNSITEKVCLCEGLVSSFYLKNNILKAKESKAVTICPGPNLAYFSGTYSLDEMVKHIYGRLNLLEGVSRPHVFINELKLYLDYLKNDIHMNIAHMNIKKEKYHKSFKEQLQNGINYYKDLMPKMLSLKNDLRDRFNQELLELELKLNNIQLYSVKD
jgi:hypothetical protein